MASSSNTSSSTTTSPSMRVTPFSLSAFAQSVKTWNVSPPWNRAANDGSPDPCT